MNHQKDAIKLEIELPLSKKLGMESKVTLNVTPEFNALYKLKESLKHYFKVNVGVIEKKEDIYSWFYCHAENELDGIIRGALEEFIMDEINA